MSCMVSPEHTTSVSSFSAHQDPPIRFRPQIKKPMRTQHCFSCDACVAKQDHHSIWINGCIGTSSSARSSSGIGSV